MWGNLQCQDVNFWTVCLGLSGYTSLFYILEKFKFSTYFSKYTKKKHHNVTKYIKIREYIMHTQITK